MTTIACTSQQDPEKATMLADHLKSKDFFNAKKFSNATFETTKLAPIAGAKWGTNNYTVTGKMTIKGIAHEITFPAEIRENFGSITVKGKFTIDRAKWEAKYNSGSFFKDLGDNLIKDEIQLEVNLYYKFKG